MRAAASTWAGATPEVVEQDVLEAQERIRQRLLGARRLFLMLISGEPERKAAWEVLVGPVDWEKAQRVEPQDNEPFPVSMREPDMVLAVEAGLLHDAVGAGRDLTSKIREAVEGANARPPSG
jgi:hypothetical protein